MPGMKCFSSRWLTGVDRSSNQRGRELIVLPRIEGHLFSLGGGFRVWFAGVSLAKVDRPESLLRKLREEGKTDYVLGVKADYVAGVSHLLMVVQQAWSACRGGVSLAKKFEIEVLLRLVCTTQISEAIRKAGVTEEDHELVLIVVGRSLSPRKILPRVRPYGAINTSIMAPDTNRLAFLRSFHSISSSLEDATRGLGSSLPHLLAERAALLVS